MSDELKNKSLLRKAYRVAKREGYILRKSRRAISPQNHGGLMLVDPSTGAPMVGWNYDATPQDVLNYLDDLPWMDTEGRRPSGETSPDDFNGGNAA